MKKYKHKLTGNIAEETSSEKNYKVSNPQNFTVPKWMIENSSEWELIEDKDYEIISFKNIHTQLLMEQDRGGYRCLIAPDKTPYTEEECLNLAQLEIYSVKRLSDNEVFTVGDFVVADTFQFYIFGIELVNNSLGKYIIVKDSQGTPKCLNTIEKEAKKEPLFTTEDGVDIFEGDTYYEVSNSTLESLSATAIHFRDYSSYLSRVKTFSTLKAANNWIKCNKPVFSFDEISKVLYSKDFDDVDQIKNEFKELLKKKKFE